MNQRKTVSLLLAGLLALALLSGCGKHTHTPGELWERDMNEHWHFCECGERVDIAAHSLQNDVCLVCGSEIWDAGDAVYVYNYNDTGTVLRTSAYDPQGHLLNEYTYSYLYNPDGLLLREECCENGTLIQEAEYDTDGNLLFSRFYEEGEIAMETANEYALHPDGWHYLLRSVEYVAEPGATYSCEYNPYGDLVSRVKYDSDNNVMYTEQYEREYDADGQPLREKTYTNGILTYEIVGYTTVTEEDGRTRFPSETVEYYEDGAKLVCVYGDNGEVATETYIMADGTLGRALRYEYQTDINGNWNYIRVYEGDRQVTETRYETTEEGWNYRATLINFRKDGSRQVFHYDENGELLEEIEYDTNGERIP